MIMNITIGNFSIMYMNDKANNTVVEIESKTNVALPIFNVIIGYNHWVLDWRSLLIFVYLLFEHYTFC
jgi:hypothetical protein